MAARSRRVRPCRGQQQASHAAGAGSQVSTPLAGLKSPWLLLIDMPPLSNRKEADLTAYHYPPLIEGALCIAHCIALGDSRLITLKCAWIYAGFDSRFSFVAGSTGDPAHPHTNLHVCHVVVCDKDGWCCHALCLDRVVQV